MSINCIDIISTSPLSPSLLNHNSFVFSVFPLVFFIHSECLDKWEGRKEELCGKIEEEYLDWMGKNEIFGTFVQHFDAFRILG